MLYLFGWHLFCENICLSSFHTISDFHFLAQSFRWPCIWVIWAGGGVGLYVVRELVGGSGPVWPALLFECTTFTTPSHPPTSPYLTLFKVSALLVQSPKPHITAIWKSKSVSQLDKGTKERPTLKSILFIKSLGWKFLAALFLVF